MSYEYEVNGSKLTGSGIVPGALAGKSRGTTLSKSVYLRADGSLKFPPNAEVDVFYDPKKPSDAALVPGVPPGLWKGFALLLLFIGIPGELYEHRAWAGRNGVDLALAALMGGGAISFAISLKWLRNYFRSRGFPSTTGRILKAEVAYADGGEGGGGGYVPVVQFDYTVNGALYESSQLTSVSFHVLKSRAEAQSFVDRLRAEPGVTVYYDPRAPWVGFLQHSSIWSVILPAIMGLAFVGISAGAWVSLHRR